jgi:hypothetical protein
MPVRLYLASSFEAAWEHALLPWFEAAAPRAFEKRAPVAVVLPHRTHGQLLRSKLLAHGISLLAVKFLTPVELRESLQCAGAPRVPLREHLRLLLSVAADQCASEFERDGKTGNAQIARAVGRDPDELLRAIDNVAAAGANFADLASPAVAEIAKRFEQTLQRCNCALVSEADRWLLENVRPDPERFANLLLSGFDAAHWSRWPLLRAAAQSAKDASVILRQPRDEAAELDQTWISTWEEKFGPAQQLLPSESEPRFAALLTLPETRDEIEERKRNPVAGVHFAIAHDGTEQARAVVALATAFLNESGCERLAILLPRRGALARFVAGWLERLGIPHNDGVAHPLRGPLDDEEWRAWLSLQEPPRLGSLLRFLSHSFAARAFFEPLSFRRIQEILQRAFSDILIDAVDVLREYCTRHTEDEQSAAVARGLRAIRFLPERATFAQFVRETDSIFRQLKWNERAAELERFRRSWSENFADEFPREYFLRWLREIFADSSLLRDPVGDHSYARVQLLPYDEAEGETWSHVIFAGLNEGVWPPREDESPFLSDDAIAALNWQNQKESARFGEGQSVAREGATLCLKARDRRALALGRLLNVIEGTTHEIGVVAERYTQSPREQAINPSDFFVRLYFSARGEALSQREIDRLHARTRDWIAGCDFLKAAEPAGAEVKQTAVAYGARRTNAPFGEYEFAFREGSPPTEQISLSATDIGNLLQRPALVWMKHFLGVEADEKNGGSWALATGTWVHRWLATIGAPGENRFVPRPSTDEIIERVTRAANAFRAEILAILNACGRSGEPDWWRTGWRNARYLAEQFAQQVAGEKDWPRLATEWRLDSPHVIPLDNGEELRVHGRVDLILARERSCAEIWIIDYKTGDAKPLKKNRSDLRKQLIVGNGVQICIYALALKRDFQTIDASLLTRDAPLEPQAAIGDILRQREVWKEIARMQSTGVFGMLGEIRSEFTFTGTYPLATLAIDKDLLKEKWERTHPAFARDKTNADAS